jgi:hypothetical protein
MSDYGKELSALTKTIETLSKEVFVLGKLLNHGNKPSYTTEDVLEIFGVSQPTLRKWRNEGLIGYSQVGSTFCYSPDDITNFLKSNHYDAYAQ